MSVFNDLNILLAELGGGVFWPNEYLYDALNEALLEVWVKTRPQYVSATLGLVANDDRVAIPSTIMVPRFVLRDNLRYFVTTHAKLEQFDRSWKSNATGVPKHFVLWDAETLRVFPRPNGSYTFVVWGIGWPTEFSSSNQDLSVDRRLKDAIVKRAGATVVEYVHPGAAEVLRAEAEQLENMYKISRRNAFGHVLHQLRPGTRLTAAQSGVIDIGNTFR